MIWKRKEQRRAIGIGLFFCTKGGGFVVNCKIDEGSSDDNVRFDIGNYFIVKEEALSMARKLRAVLAGADVIEMPSEVEMSQQAVDIAWKRQDDYYYKNGESVFCYGECYDSASDMYYWLKSKIIK